MNELDAVFDDIILGRGVKRYVHELLWQGRDESDRFRSCLLRRGFEYLPLKEIEVEIGERLPGFWIDKTTAYFGYLFWEVFSENRKRKIWGSVIRDEKGDWKHIFPGKSSKLLYVNRSIRQKVDIYHLT